VAIVDGSTDAQALADDIFLYSGLGCRNVSHLFLPAGYDVEGLARVFNGRACPSTGYFNNFVQRRAVLTMQGAEFVAGDYFILSEGDDFPEYISEITYSYGDPDAWLEAHRGHVQCVVGRDVAFGCAHSPSLDDYPDGVDTLHWLQNRC
jgi:hypothetical protein